MENASGRHKVVLYALGSNGRGQLGVDNEDDHDEPQRCQFSPIPPHPGRYPDAREQIVDYVPLFEEETIVKLASGGNHTLLLTSRGRVFAAGLNDVGQCMFRSAVNTNLPVTTEATTTLRSPGSSSTLWRWVAGTDVIDDSNRLRVTDISCTWSASFFVINNVEIVSCGAGDRGELGLGPDTKQANQSQTCFDLNEFAAEHSVSFADTHDLTIDGISTGMAHVVVKLSDGSLIGWGASRKGQLGSSLKDKGSIWSASIIGTGSSPPDTYFAVTGRDWTFVVDSTGSGKLLGDDTKMNIESAWYTCAQDKRLTPIAAIKPGWSSITALTQHGQLSGFGKYDRGQLPPSELSQDRPTVERLAVGSEHSLAVLEDGRVITWGWGEHGNCGSNIDEKRSVRNRFNVLFPAQVVDSMVKASGQQVLGVAAGCATSFFWTSD